MHFLKNRFLLLKKVFCLSHYIYLYISLIILINLFKLYHKKIFYSMQNNLKNGLKDVRSTIKICNVPMT